MQVRAKRGLNQKGICYLNSKYSGLDGQVCRLSSGVNGCLADIRLNENVSSDMIVLDLRVFAVLGVQEGDAITVAGADLSVKPASEIALSVSSTQGIDSAKVADAISKRVQDLREDFDGIILQEGDSIQVDRLGLGFSVTEIRPESPGRITWSRLDNIRLIPRGEDDAGPMNLVCAFEVGGAAHIKDANKDEGFSQPRYQMWFHFLSGLSHMQGVFGRGGEFAGLAFSDDVHFLETFDSETGRPRETARLDSASVITAYEEWIRGLLDEKQRSPSDLGDAVSDSIAIAEGLVETNNLPVVVVVFSSGVFSVG
ncbi:hypothetical protein EU545_01875, partial [Candidatus Thorarchaeota archaeon]